MLFHCRGHTRARGMCNMMDTKMSTRWRIPKDQTPYDIHVSSQWHRQMAGAQQDPLPGVTDIRKG